MIIFINDKNEIKDVGTTNKDNLTALVIPKDDNPFEGWSNAKICCYAVQLDRDGNIGGYYPYVDTTLIPVIEDMSPTKYTQKAYIGDNKVVFENVVKGNVSIYITTESGKILSAYAERVNDSVWVMFEDLEEVATVTISVL